LVGPSEPLSHLFFVDSGRLRCAVASPDGDTKTVLYLWPGDIIGETDVFGADSIPLVVTSLGRSIVRVLPPGEVRRLVAEEPGLAAELLDVMARKTHAILEQVRELRFLAVDQRVVAFLRMMCVRESVGSSAGPNGAEKDLRVTHDEIADYVGAHRVSVTEALSRIERAGVIETRRGHIVVKDIEGLGRVVAG
jgi:CRP-like cAMP-binding protein